MIIKKLTPLAILGFFLFFSLYGNAQQAEEPDIPKFGKDLLAELEMKSCEIDSNANAFVLFDDGRSIMRYKKEHGSFYLEIERHKRIKIINKDGFRWADVTIPLQQSSGGSKEKLVSFKAATYNLKNGKIDKSKLSKGDVYEEDYSENLSLIKFTMPKVEEGSVIEYSYKITSDFTYNLQPWDFQAEIPSLVSNYTVSFPEFYKYNLQISGYAHIEANKTTERETFTQNRHQHHQESTFGRNHRTTETHRVSYLMDRYNFYAYNIPALKEEPFTDNSKNYLSHIDFELLYTQFPNRDRQEYAADWNSVTQELLNRNDFGHELRRTSFLSEEIKEISDSLADGNEKMFAVLGHIHDKVKWNKKYRLLTDKGVKKAYSEGSGNSAEVNLLLIGALREAGLDAFPIVLSTRSSGIIQQWQVSISKFNHVIAGAIVEENFFYIDATDPFSAPNVLPLECLNGQARIIEEERSNWINLNPIHPSQTTHQAEFHVTESSDVKGTVQQNFFDHAALRMNEVLKKQKEEGQIESLSERFEIKEVSDVKVNLRSFPRPVINLQYEATMSESVLQAGNLLYISPGKGLIYKKNPLTKPNRKLPINFHFPSRDHRVFSYAIPEGYATEELPQNVRFSILEGKMQYSYNIVEIGGKIVITVTLSINQPDFPADHYGEIQSFFDDIVNQNNKKIILNKK